MHTARLRALPETEKECGLWKIGRWATPDEAQVIWTLAQCCEIRTYLECGTANGYTALWAAAAGIEHIHTWDIVDRPKLWAHNPDLVELGSRIRCHVKPFDEGVGHVYAPGPRMFFIDGGHERHEVRKDWKAVRLLVQKGDVLVFHDASVVENILELCRNLRLIHGYHGGIIQTDRGVGVYFP